MYHLRYRKTSKFIAQNVHNGTKFNGRLSLKSTYKFYTQIAAFNHKSVYTPTRRSLDLLPEIME